MPFFSLPVLFSILIPPPCGGTKSTDGDSDSVWPSGWNLVGINACKYTEESEVALDHVVFGICYGSSEYLLAVVAMALSSCSDNPLEG